MRRAGRIEPHLEVRVNCKSCPLSYCPVCQPKGCECGNTAYYSEHNGIKYEGDVKKESHRGPTQNDIFTYYYGDDRQRLVRAAESINQNEMVGYVNSTIEPMQIGSDAIPEQVLTPGTIRTGTARDALRIETTARRNGRRPRRDPPTGELGIMSSGTA